MSLKEKKLVLIDDDKKLLDLTARYLSENGWLVFSATEPNAGRELVRLHSPLLIVLDVMMPEKNGFELCVEIRKESDVPIIMVTARGEVDDRIQGLKCGADDYLLKPFEPRELLARMETILRRHIRIASEDKKSRILRFSELEIDVDARSASLNGNSVSLTTTEFDILILFAMHPGKILSRNEMMDKLRGASWNVFNRSIDLAISRLRQKLKDDPRDPKFFKTVWGEGYLFIAKPETT